MRLLITGASGLLGSKIAEIALNRGYEVYSAYNQHHPPHGIPVNLDLLDRESCEKVLETVKPEVVIHSAALTNVDICEKEKDFAWKINVRGTETIARLCKRLNCFMILISTDYIFDGEKGLYSEEDEPNPINYYGYTKLMAERAVKRLLKDYCIARTSVIFGSRPTAGKINFVLWILENLEKGKRINVVVDQVNSPTFNTNLAKMVLEIAERSLTGIYHLAGATPISRYDFATLLAREFGLNDELIQPTTFDRINWVAKRPRNTSLNVSKASKDLRDKPMSIQKAVRELKKELELGGLT